MSTQHTIGVVAISFNEASDLPGFLKHLLPWVDEIVIVDDGSTDQTAQIARDAGQIVRFLDSPRADGEYYADQRNKGIQAATADWLIHMDIDERIPADLGLEIVTAIRRDAFDAFRYRRLNYFLHRPMKGGDWTNWNQVHLARRELLEFSGMYHEKVELSVSEDRIGQLEALMVHLNDDSYAERLRKSSRYQFEVAERLQRSGKSIRGLNIIWSFLREFIYQFIWKKGFRDGTVGLVWAFHAASAANRAHLLAWDEGHRISRGKIEKSILLEWDELLLAQISDVKRGS
jgi:glycosyltransferase involved in cell wall biosynthesis